MIIKKKSGETKYDHFISEFTLLWRINGGISLSMQFNVHWNLKHNTYDHWQINSDEAISLWSHRHISKEVVP